MLAWSLVDMLVKVLANMSTKSLVNVLIELLVEFLTKPLENLLVRPLFAKSLISMLAGSR